MDNQNFNDQELSDIMKEIESLEEEFNPESFKKPTPVMEQLSEMPVEAVVAAPKAVEKKEAQIHHFEAPKSKAQSAMSFKVEGQMNIDLCFEIGGKTVNVAVTEQGLSIVMDGGMSFNVPVNQKKSA